MSDTLKTMQELYAMKAALEKKGFSEASACRIIVSQTGQRMSDAQPVGSPPRNA